MSWLKTVANTFTLRVEHTGGHITTKAECNGTDNHVDEMHLRMLFSTCWTMLLNIVILSDR